ncbi:MAG: AGE family epimerase/isomerase, partial [Deltaproteobacteria bacterium]|nr:AGE family epimerase/isomerase [Deltaproteobacteria bacterium]
SDETRTGKPDAPASTSMGGARLDESSVTEIARIIMDAADHAHGGYGNGQKFIQSEPNDFLLSLYETAKNAEYLNHVCLTLDGMRNGAIHDDAAGGFFRTSTGPDWDQPHREKLLAEQAGLLSNCLRAYGVTQRPEYARMAEDIIEYLNRKLFDHTTGAFYGCEDFLRVENAEQTSGDEFFTILDRCIYTDANALAIIAYLKAAESLGNEDLKLRALGVLEFIWSHCSHPAGGMFHYFDGAPQLSGWLRDQVLMGIAMLEVHKSTGEPEYLDRAKELAEFIVNCFKNPAGGFFDLAAGGSAYLSVRLTLIEHNGPAASFFLALGAATGDLRWREAAFWALSAFTEDFGSYGTHAAALGRALIAYFQR